MIQNYSKPSFSCTTLNPQNMLNFGCIGPRLMLDFRFEKLFFKMSPWIFLNRLQPLHKSFKMCSSKMY